MARLWFDAHLDLAYLAVNGRDMLRPLAALADRAGPHPPASVTLPALAEGGVRLALATIFTEPIDAGTAGDAGGTPAPPALAAGTPAASSHPRPEQYPAGDAARAHAVGRAQLEAYLTWRDLGRMTLDLRRVLHADAGVGEVRAGMGVADVVPAGVARRVKDADRAVAPARDARAIAELGLPLHAGILIENADPIREPDELGWWAERGVVAVGLAWGKPSRYAGGNMTDLGLTDLGRALIREMDRLGVVHDASHLSDRAMRELLDLTDATVVASHSNCRALLGGGGMGERQRHLHDDWIREIAGRNGVIGLNLFGQFLTQERSPEGRATTATVYDAIRQVLHICELTGSRNHVGLGSDMDGGFGADMMPRGVRRPADLERLAEALAKRGFDDADLAAFTHGNWARVFAGTLE